jgi:hypothetical protein
VLQQVGAALHTCAAVVVGLPNIAVRGAHHRLQRTTAATQPGQQCAYGPRCGAKRPALLH